MKAAWTRYEHGQSPWLDSATRVMLDSGQIQHYIDRYAVTVPTSNPSIFDKSLAVEIIPELTSKTEPELDHDSSTNALIRRYRTLKG